MTVKISGWFLADNAIPNTNSLNDGEARRVYTLDRDRKHLRAAKYTKSGQWQNIDGSSCRQPGYWACANSLEVRE
jgi:hypothetical protein